MRRDTLLGTVHGIFAAQLIKPQARVLANDRGISCVRVDYDLLRGLTALMTACSEATDLEEHPVHAKPVPTKRYPSLFESSVMRRDRRKVKRSGRVISPAQSGN